MTREEAIRILECDGYTSNPVEIDEALKMAIEALKEMSAEEYRQRLMEVFHNTDHDELLTYVVMPKEEEFKSLEYILRQYKFEPRLHGEWKKKTDGVPHIVTIEWFVCSECGVQKSEETPFCPNCGADMRGKNDE